MTIEKKRELVGYLCNNFDCEFCPCKGDTDPTAWCNHHNHHIMSDEYIDLALHQFGCADLVDSDPVVANSDPVTHPSHYTQGNIQCIDAMESAFGKEAVATWCKLNSFKYIWRSEHKNGMEDIDKAIWYLNKFKELSASG